MMWFIRTLSFTLLLVAAAIWDIRHREVPKGVIPGIFFAGFLCFNPIRLFGVLAGLPIFIFALIFMGRTGFGDVWLTVAAGFVVGFGHGLWAQIIAYSAMLLFYLGCGFIRKIKPKEKVPEQPYPLVPFLSLGFLAVYFL